MTNFTPDQVYNYEYNLFAYPANYFREHTAKELKLTEEERQQLIKEQEEFQERLKKNRSKK